MLNLNHKNLDVWKLSMDVVSEIYEVTTNFPKREMFCLTNQLRRAIISIPSNIAEGSSRKSTVERKRFFEIARSSLVEIDTQIEISKRLNYLNEKEIKILELKCLRLFQMLSALIRNSN